MINLLRNREVLIYFAALFISGIAAILSALFLNGVLGIIIIILSVVFAFVCSVLFTARRYRDI
ncbi:MAG: hypothetical protein LBU94_00045, partial [Clostridiales bacterium]|nr:hypothetical protein [Clostridiales bacterium]